MLMLFGQFLINRKSNFRVNFHMIFDVKIEDFRRKARLLTGGHVTEPPATITYVGVVSREIVRIVLALAALN